MIFKFCFDKRQKLYNNLLGLISHVMSIPDYQATMLPLLRFSGDGAEHSLRDAIESLAGEFKLSDEDRRELLPSGQQEVFANRVGWARTYMKKAGLLRTTRRGSSRLPTVGRAPWHRSQRGLTVSFSTSIRSLESSRHCVSSPPQTARLRRKGRRGRRRRHWSAPTRICVPT